MTKTMLAAIDAHIEEGRDRALRELAELCSIPSVSAHGGPAMAQAADWVAQALRRRGLQARVYTTPGHPIVVGARQGKSAKTLLFYNHYDVQPPEPLELWDSPPFELAVRDGKAFARGVSDDKGHLISRLAALDAVLAVHGGDPPCAVKFIVEGEEETSSASIPGFVEENRELLAADACVWEFGGVNHRGDPMQYLGLRGICYVELSVETGTLDAHSGLGGSIFPNAAWRLAWALASLKGPDERILIPGFYDRVKPPTDSDRELMAALPDQSGEYQRTYGVKRFLKGSTKWADLAIQEVFEPTCTICGITAGYQGPGPKTVLPCRASAKVDFRLVPDQHPQEILEKLRAHLRSQGFEDVAIHFHGGEPPARTDPDHPFVKMVVEAARGPYGKPQMLVPMVGGSGPNHAFVHTLGLPVVTCGIGYPGAQVHAPNEHFIIDNFITGTKHAARILMGMSAL